MEARIIALMTQGVIKIGDQGWRKITIALTTGGVQPFSS